MPSKATANKFKISIILTLIVFCFVVFWFRIPIWEKITDLYRLFSDREKIRLLISSFGNGAPPVFMLVQILQVIFAPVPGEATGFIGGYLFGTLPGFIYSSIGLTGLSVPGAWCKHVTDENFHFAGRYWQNAGYISVKSAG
jgi:uncharacterized membrane protein YdjX (TVP38/TMEM64 family)